LEIVNMVKLVALRGMSYATRRLRAGDEFDARPRDARVLIAVQRARLASLPAVAPAVAPGEQGIDDVLSKGQGSTDDTAAPEDIAEAAPDGIAGEASEDVAEAAPDGIAGEASEDVAEAVPDGIAGEASEDVAEAAPAPAPSQSKRTVRAARGKGDA
jgi:hypothetical protein